MISKKTFCMNTVSVGRLRAQASAYFCTSASSWSRGTTLLRKLQSYISAAVKALPVNTISWNFRMPMVCAHHHMRGPQPKYRKEGWPKRASSLAITRSASAAW